MRCECCGSDEDVGNAPQAVMTEVSQTFGIKRMYPNQPWMPTCLHCDVELFKLHNVQGLMLLAKVRGPAKNKKPKKKGKSQ